MARAWRTGSASLAALSHSHAAPSALPIQARDRPTTDATAYDTANRRGRLRRRSLRARCRCAAGFRSAFHGPSLLPRRGHLKSTGGSIKSIVDGAVSRSQRSVAVTRRVRILRLY